MRQIDRVEVVAAATQRWQANAALREEFGGNQEAYIAFATAEAKGLCRIDTTKVVGSAKALLAVVKANP